MDQEAPSHIDDVATKENDDEVAINSDMGQLTGGEHFLVGLSPQYWAHIPMLVDQFHRLSLVDGIDCVVIRMQNAPIKLIPVSKCNIVGVIVNVERKPNGSILYLVDDGTGMVDCLRWTDNDHYRLASLSSTKTEHLSDNLTVGQIVRVMGRIKVLSIGNVSETMLVGDKKWEFRDAVREVHVHLIETVTPLDPRRQDTSEETLHWIKCMKFYNNCQTCERSTDSAGQNPEYYVTEFAAPSVPFVRNGKDVLELLGPSITRNALVRTDLPAADDAIGAWKVFGTSCRCDLPYKESLLYCHCQATIEPLDPHFVFRDAILSRLLQYEAKSNSSCRFHYQTLINEPTLDALAARILVKGETGDLRRLFVKTFAALRKDGIVHLLNAQSDTYQLISRKGSLEPYVLAMADKSIANLLQRKAHLRGQRVILRNVPIARLQYVKRCLQDQSNIASGP